MRCITSPTSCPQYCHRRSQRFEVLAHNNLTWRNKHYQRRHWSIATSYDHLLSRRLQAPHCQRCLPCSSNSSANHHPLIPMQTLQELLLCLRTQALLFESWLSSSVLTSVFLTHQLPVLTIVLSPPFKTASTYQSLSGDFVLLTFPRMTPYPSFITFLFWRVFVLPYN
jgi:hypothetical protein